MDPDNTLQQHTPERQVLLDPSRLWAGGCAAALVAAGVALVGYLFFRGILSIPLVGARPSGAVIQISMLGYAFAAAIGAAVATGVAHLLLLTTPRPRTFFNWVMALAIIASGLLPLGLDKPLDSTLATAFLNVVIGVSIAVLVSMSVGASQRPVRVVPVDPGTLTP